MQFLQLTFITAIPTNAGFPSVGKSTLLTKLTETESLIAAYEFTTLTCIPGVIYYKGAKLQVYPNDAPSLLSPPSLLASLSGRAALLTTRGPRWCVAAASSSICPVLSREPRTARVEVSKSSVWPAPAT